ncbi:hypothetical protein BJX66DRAFT_341917 [Aspergillus keveii]|uniref:Zn(2)-C6 fungal-type domain-containing protein n=1 Tax=Aspergillus keveii TaxID=714993 RepID=A0ABR4FTZ1_9EURO
MPKHSDRSPRPHNRKGSPDMSRKRTVTSCDICKGRKTKCIDPVPGPCKYCASISAECTITIKRRQRPFYLVSEQEYRYGIDILQKVFPETDLNMDTLRQLAQSMNSQQAGGTGTSQPAIAPVGPPSQPSLSGRPSPEEVCPEMATQVSLEAPAITTAPVADDPIARPESEAVGDSPHLLAQDKGCLIIDSLGTTRYVGPQSDIFFISAVRSQAQGQMFRPLMGRMRFPLSLPPSPESRNSKREELQLQSTCLPPRQNWASHIDRYFKEVNSTYWLISLESFCSRLDSTYARPNDNNASASWLCFLYAVLALASQAPEPSPAGLGDCAETLGLPTPNSRCSSDQPTSNDVRALAAMSIFLHNQGFAVPSYLNIGSAVRIAYTLGLHQPEPYSEMTTVNREAALRVAWTLYQLDCEISRPPGRPCNIEVASWHPIKPSDMTVSTGTYDPWGLFNHSVDFNMEDHRIFATLSKTPTPRNRGAALDGISAGTSALQALHRALPPHLQWDAPLAPPHRRPICLVHLRHWSSIIKLTRLALLSDVQSAGPRGTQNNQGQKLSTLGQLCMEASGHSYKILAFLHSSALLSSLTVVDTKHILETAMVILLLLTRWPSQKLQGRLEGCMDMLRSMETLGFCKFGGRDLVTIVSLYKEHFGRRTGGSDGVDYGDLPLPLDFWTQAGDAPMQSSQFPGLGMELLWTQEASSAGLNWGLFSWDALVDLDDLAELR